MLITSHVILTCRHPRSEDSRTSTLMLSSFMSSWLSLFTAKSGMKTLPDGINPTRRLNLQNGWDMHHWTTLASFSEVWMGCDASGSISDDVRSLWKERAVGWISGTMFMVCEIHFLLSWGMADFERYQGTPFTTTIGLTPSDRGSRTYTWTIWLHANSSSFSLVRTRKLPSSEKGNFLWLGYSRREANTSKNGEGL